MPAKKASISTTPRSQRVYIIRYRMPWQVTVQRQVLLGLAATTSRVGRLREAGAEVQSYGADVGEWHEV